MRRLLVKLVAVETALVGWLGYWIFLVYSTNPLVSGGLATQLSRFPQVSFTTVDITVLVLIGCLSILLAFKFDRGLKPGIRLERALQMLESLMKRNLMLEAQIAEMKMASVQATSIDGQAHNEPPLGSWERAFRTPIEAGPPTRYRSTRTDAKTAQSNSPLLKTVTRTSPEDAPPPSTESYNESGQPSSTEVSNIWTLTQTPASSATQPSPSRSPRKPSAIAQPSSRRQPYIPVPAAKASFSSSPSPSASPTSRAKSSQKSTAMSTATLESGDSSSAVLPSAYQPGESDSSAVEESLEITRSVLQDDYKQDDDEGSAIHSESPSQAQTSSKASASTRKRFPWEDQ